MKKGLFYFIVIVFLMIVVQKYFQDNKKNVSVTTHSQNVTVSESNDSQVEENQSIFSGQVVGNMKKLIFKDGLFEQNHTLSEMMKGEKREYSVQRMPMSSNLESIDFHERLKQLDAKEGDHVFIRIFKLESMLEVWLEKDGEYRLFKYYSICNYSGFLGPKLKEGDKQAPEGFYEVPRGMLNPNSSYHLSFNLGFPNRYDRAHGRTGSYLMVHGRCESVGCYAMRDEPIEEIYGLVESALKNGQKRVKVHIFPFRMSEERMAHYQDHRWYDFWQNLKEGYDYFEAERIPPRVVLKGRRYAIYEAKP